MRLIDGDRAKDILVRYANAPHVRLDGGMMTIAIDTCIRLLDNSPNIDAVPVLRCKDCKHYKEINGKSARMACFVHLLTPHPMLPDDFCSRGERKDGACDAQTE